MPTKCDFGFFNKSKMSMQRPEYHCSELRISKERLLRNFKRLSDCLSDRVLQMSVVKANAYGHGDVQVSKILEDKTDWFAVATVTEALRLRESGITKPILVFEPPQKDRATYYVSQKLTAVISHEDHFSMLPSGVQAHIEWDTGMGRLGFLPEQLPLVLACTKKFEKQIHISGIFTHFATADQQNSDFVGTQKKRFEAIIPHFPGAKLRYAANSGGILHYPDAHYDMVRHGIALYGYDPSGGDTELEPVMEWWTHIIQTRRIPKGWKVSYDAAWEAPDDGFLSILPVGYADGLTRRLSHKLEVRIADSWYRVVGNITMDYCMVFTENKAFPTGTEVLLMGGARNHAAILAHHSDTIAYEILSRISSKVIRKVV